MDMSLVPYVIEQTSRGERSYDIFSRLLNDRIIMLNDEVNNASASIIIAQMLYLEGQDPEKDINFYINSPGGAQGQATDILIHAHHIEQIRSNINKILAEETGKPLEQIQIDTERDNFMTAAEAAEYGLIDKVISKR